VTLKFAAVKDAVFGPYTPSGNLEMAVVKSAGESLELGAEYLLTLVPAEQFIVEPVEGTGRITIRPK